MVKGLAHVALLCRDVEKSADFYTRVLGMKRLFDQTRPDGSLWYIYLHAGNRTFLELFPTEHTPNDAKHAGMTHLCLAVEDINAAAAAVTAAGWALTAQPRLGRDGNWQAWLADPDGVAIELMQMMPDSMQNEALSASQDQT